MGAGRPSDYSAELADRICEELAGGKSLVAICEADNMPSARTVHRWIVADEDFCQKYARAREAQADFLAEECLAIADTPLEGIRTEETDDGLKTIREDMLGHRRLQIDARKWFASKVAPKKYGDRVGHDINTNVNIAFAINAAPLPTIAADVECVARQREDGPLSHDGANGFVLSAPLPPETGRSGK